MSFESISPAPPDAILGLTESFKSDANPNKINLGVGVYQDETGVTPVLPSVRAAEEKILAASTSKAYLPISGTPEYGRLLRELLFGEEQAAMRSGAARTAHTPGGTGALRVGADFLKLFLSEGVVWMSSPTWANHKGIFGAAGLEVREYPYYDREGKTLDVDRMLSALKDVPAGHVVLLHVCCHNPTGVDPSADQWKEIAAVAAQHRWIPFLDFAYQGFGETVEADRAGVLAIAETGIEFFVASSFSKNFGLYQDRTGALTFSGASPQAADAAFTHIKRVIRVNYSNPPAHGGHVVQTILGDSALREQWRGELNGMRDRIKSMRSALVEGLRAQGVTRDFSFIQRQNGMFSFSGLSDEQVTFLREQKSIYIVKGGRINVAGITPGNIEYLCASAAAALEVGK